MADPHTPTKYVKGLHSELILIRNNPVDLIVKDEEQNCSMTKNHTGPPNKKGRKIQQLLRAGVSHCRRANLEVSSLPICYVGSPTLCY